MVGHGQIHLGGKLDEFGVEIVLARLPTQIVRVDRDAVTAHTRAGVERHVPKGLGLGRLDDLPNVNVHAFGEKRQFVDQRNVHTAKNVLQQLGHLGRAGRGHNVDMGKELGQQRACQFGAERRHAAHNLGRVLHGVLLVARIDPLRREGQIEILTRFQAGFLQNG